MTFLLDQDTPDDVSYSLRTLGHQVIHVRNVLPVNASDAVVFAHAQQQGWVIITCNRDDFLALAKSEAHRGLIILIRKKTRVAERVALVRLIDRAGESGIANNINFA